MQQIAAITGHFVFYLYLSHQWPEGQITAHQEIPNQEGLAPYYHSLSLIAPDYGLLLTEYISTSPTRNTRMNLD